MGAELNRFRTWGPSLGSTILALVLIEYFAVPQLVHAASDLTLIADAAPLVLLLALLLEVCSVLSYTSLTRAVLPVQYRPTFADQFRIDLTGLGFSHVVPGGGASAAALRFRLMAHRGIPAMDAAATAAVQTALAAIALVATFVGGVVLAGVSIRSHPGFALGGLAAVAFLCGAVWMINSSGPVMDREAPPHQRDGVGPQWLSRLARAGLETAGSTIGRARLIVHDPHRRAVVLGWASGNWLFDAASLWTCLWAYGIELHPAALLMAYGAANLIGMLPVTPGGLGVVEGTLVPAVVALGGAALAPVTLGVITWRLMEFWLPIPVAGLCYLSLRWSPGAEPPEHVKT